MTTTLTSEDGKLIFSFESDRWTLVQAFDTLPDVEKFCKSKLDFIGVWDNKRLFLIEVKNLRNRPIQANILPLLRADDGSNYDRKNPPLVKSIVDSVKDSLLFMALSSRYDTVDKTLWEALEDLILAKKVEIYAVFCLETDNEYLPKIPADKLKVHKTSIIQRLKMSLNPICKDVFLVDSNNAHLIPQFKIAYQN